MELRQLAYFVTVAHEESFTRAAARLHVAQPGVSQQIRRLEAELGTPLFDRSGRRPRLTPAGNALLPHARDALAASDAGRAALAALNGIVSGRLQLGTIPGIPSIDLPSLLAAFHAAHPRVEITFDEGQPLPLIESVRRDDHDAVIVGLSTPDPPDGLSVEVIDVEPLVLVTSPDHPLAAGRSTSAQATSERDVRHPYERLRSAPPRRASLRRSRVRRPHRPRDHRRAPPLRARRPRARSDDRAPLDRRPRHRPRNVARHRQHRPADHPATHCSGLAHRPGAATGGAGVPDHRTPLGRPGRTARLDPMTHGRLRGSSENASINLRRELSWRRDPSAKSGSVLVRRRNCRSLLRVKIATSSARLTEIIRRLAGRSPPVDAHERSASCIA